MQDRITEILKKFNVRVAIAKIQYPDFDDKVTNNRHFKIKDDLFFMLIQEEFGPHILYHMAILNQQKGE
jgi:hypothetical protein